jgi:hypothetical protein
MKRHSNSFQREAFKAFYEELNKNGNSVFELSDTEWVKEMLIDRLQRHGIIDETTNDLKERLRKNRSHILDLASGENTPILVNRDSNNGIIESYFMFVKIKLTPEERKYMEELAIREIDYKVTKEKISEKALERLCNNLIKNGTLSANNEKIQEILDKKKKIELALAE